MRKQKKLFLLITTLMFAFALPLVANAQEGTKYREEIRTFQNKLDEVKKSETSKYTSEISQIDNWINEALVKIGQEDYSTTRSLNIKTAVYLDYVKAGIKRDKIKIKQKEVEDALAKLKTEKGTLEAEVQQLAAQEKKLSNTIN